MAPMIAQPVRQLGQNTSSPRHADDYCVATAAEWTYDETVSTQSTEGNHEASSFVARIVNLSRRSTSHWTGGRAVAKFDAERHLQ
jgi:hypothetical protein